MPHYALSDEFRDEFNFKCLDTLIPAAKSGDTLVPSFTGEEDKVEALRWLTLFTQWALQQGLSPDHTLLLASTHINYSVIYTPQLPSWTEFVHDFFDYYDAPKGQGARFAEWYIKKKAGIQISWFSYRELKTATNNFSDHKLIGNGKKAYVFKGELCDSERNVAVKRLKDVTAYSLDEVLHEVFVYSCFPTSRSLSSRLARLVGYSSYEQDPLLVYEYIPGGNLEEYLQGLHGYRLTWDERLNIAIDTGDVLTQLHYNGTLPIYHRDVKSSNILLDEKRRARLADFGLAAIVTQEKQKTFCDAIVKGSRGCLCPHYEDTGKLTDVADVYSFGIVLMELVTGVMANDPNRSKTFLPELVVEMVKLNRVDEILDQEMTWDPSACEHCMPTIVLQVTKLAIQCCSADPAKRSNISEVTEQLRDVQLEQKIMAMEIESRVRERKAQHEAAMDKGVKFKCASIGMKMDKKKKSPRCRRRRY
ncbi:unnamed protein product [Calypogeia fissa]